MKFGNERILNTAFKFRDDVVLWDIIPVEDGESVTLTFEYKNSNWRQGVWLMCDEGVELYGEMGKSAVLWFDSSPSKITIKCHTKTGYLNIYNIWDQGFGRCSQAHSSGMLFENLPNGRRYQCNDIGFETNFDKLIFRIEISTELIIQEIPISYTTSIQKHNGAQQSVGFIVCQRPGLSMQRRSNPNWRSII